MGFTEVTFLFVFLPVSILVYLIAESVFHKDKLNNFILVVMSFIFYIWANENAVIIVATIGFFIFIAGQMAQKTGNEEQSNRLKKTIRFLIMILIGLLIFYKYASFIVSWINNLVGKNWIRIGDLIVPIGLSFIIFESVSYIVDIYRGDAEPGSFLDCFTFLFLFPKIVSGPIVLWKDFKPQLTNRRSTVDQISTGIDRIVVGFAKKAIIADTFGAQIALINSGIAGTGVDVASMWLRALLYFFQLYFDFSGYSDIAIGLFGIFGFNIKENFKYPYLSKSVTEFWRRWHISLGSWFREYVYIPLGGNRKGNVYIHLLIVFILTGIWHGTGWQFLAWGLFHGVLVILERLVSKKPWYNKIPNCIKWLFTTACVFFAWILFMSKDLPTALQTFANMFAPMTTDVVNFTWRYYLSNRTLLFLIVIIIGHIFAIGKLKDKTQLILASNAGVIVKRIILLLLFVVDILYIVNSTYSPFIYFQF